MAILMLDESLLVWSYLCEGIGHVILSLAKLVTLLTGASGASRAPLALFKAVVTVQAPAALQRTSRTRSGRTN